MDVDIEEMIKDGKKINPNLKIITTSALTGENIPQLITEIMK